jgi:hypothetical protein
VLRSVALSGLPVFGGDHSNAVSARASANDRCAMVRALILEVVRTRRWRYRSSYSTLGTGSGVTNMPL